VCQLKNKLTFQGVTQQSDLSRVGDKEWTILYHGLTDNVGTQHTKPAVEELISTHIQEGQNRNQMNGVTDKNKLAVTDATAPGEAQIGPYWTADSPGLFCAPPPPLYIYSFIP
jgi:hypothetical protein